MSEHHKTRKDTRTGIASGAGTGAEIDMDIPGMDPGTGAGGEMGSVAWFKIKATACVAAAIWAGEKSFVVIGAAGAIGTLPPEAEVMGGRETSAVP